MRKISLAFLTILIVLLAAGTRSYAYPTTDSSMYMHPFWQGDYPGDVLGCSYSDETCRKQRSDKTVSRYGCAVSSMAMLYYAYGFLEIPDKNHNPYPIAFGWTHLNPSTLNEYLSAKNEFGRPLGFQVNSIDDYRLDWLKTTSNFYYYDAHQAAYGTGLHYAYLVPNYDCEPISIEVQKKNGSFKTVKRSASCFYIDWSTPGAMTWLDYDLDWGGNYAPPIMEIEYTKYTATRRERHTHFVVIAGYEKKDGRADDVGWYRAHNPSFTDNASDNRPRALNGPTQYGKNDGKSYHLDGMLRLLRFTGKYSEDVLDTSRLDLGIHSPVEVQVVDPNGDLIGYDPETGQTFLENPMSLYYVEDAITPQDGIGSTPESHKRLTIIQPPQGAYILKLFGTGDGPYSIDMEWTKSDGTPNLITSLTGTATPSLSETYRITYSPTGEAVLSQTNQTPVANAGANQTGEQSYEITLDGSGSSDPDGDPMKYTWSFTSKPDGSTAALSDASASKPTFTPDKAGAYVLQLVVNDYFTDSAPSTATITATPIASIISATPNFSAPLSEGSTNIAFDLKNIGRIPVSSGTIDLSLTDPSGAVAV